METKVSALSNAVLQNAVNAESVKLSPKSVSSSFGLISSALTACNPDFAIRVTLPQKKKRIIELLSADTIFSVVNGTEIELPVLLAMWRGLRMSKVRGLTKHDVVGDSIIIRNVIVDLMGAVETEYFTTLSGNTISSRFARLLKKNELPHMSFHGLRHLNASITVQLNIPDKYAMERGGWATPNTLKNVCQHTFSTERIVVDNAVNNYFENILKINMQHGEMKPH